MQVRRNTRLIGSTRAYYVTPVASPLLHRKAPHVFDASRCRSMPVQRREDRSQLEHAARIATRALYPVIRSHLPPLAPGTPGEKCWMDNRTKIRYTFYTDHLHTWRPYL